MFFPSVVKLLSTLEAVLGTTVHRTLVVQVLPSHDAFTPGV